MKELEKKKKHSPISQTDIPELLDLDNFFEIPFSRIQVKRKPAINVIENDKSFEVEVAVPGLSKKDIQIRVENGILHIFRDMDHISRDMDKQPKEVKEYAFREFSYDSFDRYLSLPSDVDTEKIQAMYENGVLNLVLKKTPQAVKKRIISIL